MAKNNATSKSGFPIKFTFKVCVPVLKSKKSWVDNLCTMDDCGDYATKFNKECQNNLPDTH